MPQLKWEAKVYVDDIRRVQHGFRSPSPTTKYRAEALPAFLTTGDVILSDSEVFDFDSEH
jgi:hypothetical protein